MPTGCFTLIHCLMMNETGVIRVADVTACCFRLKGESVKKKGIEGSEKKKLCLNVLSAPSINEVTQQGEPRHSQWKSVL